MPSISPFSLPGRFWRGNLHTHSNLSDGGWALDDVVNAYKRVGYDFLMMSEHFTHHFNFPIADTRHHRGNNFTTILGAELHAPVTSAGEWWHIVAAGLPLDFPPVKKGETGPQIARRAVEAGAFVGIAHPAWSQLTIEDGRELAFAHAVEIYNHGCAVECDRGEGFYLLDQMLNEGHRHLTAFATDDAHFKAPDHFGGWVQVKAESLDPDVLLAALKRGDYYSSQGPQFSDIVVDGKEVHVSCSPVDTIAIVCGISRTAVQTGRAISGTTLNLAKLEDGWLMEKTSPWFRVVVIDQAGKRAWSNPIWTDALKG